jgi:virginiamycin B lyase
MSNKSCVILTAALPGGGNIVRNTSVTRDGNFMLANSLVNGVTLVTIKK